MSQKTRWGVPVYIGAAVAGTGAVWIAAQYDNPAFYDTTLPWIGLLISLLAFVVGHVSYPRVHSMKVFLFGYLTGVAGLGYFLLYTTVLPLPFSAPPSGYVISLLFVSFVNVAIVMAIPSNVKYRATLQISLIVTAVESIVLLWLRLVPSATDWTRFLAYDSVLDLPFWIGIVFPAGICAVTIQFLKDEFHFGGLLSGAALLYGLCWMAPVLPEATHVRPVLFALCPLFIQAGILVHWFSRMEHRISFDPLLHIYNRNYCSRIISEQSRLNASPPFGVAMVDIDHFKKVNDTCGHQAGDMVLYTVAQTVLKGCAPEGIACRYGGEELVVFFPGKETREIAEIMENVRTEIEKLKMKSGRKTITVTASFGVSHRDDKDQSIMDVIGAADKALYRAKEDGRNQVKTGKTTAGSSDQKGKSQKKSDEKSRDKKRESDEISPEEDRKQESGKENAEKVKSATGDEESPRKKNNRTPKPDDDEPSTKKRSKNQDEDGSEIDDEDQAPKQVSRKKINAADKGLDQDEEQDEGGPKSRKRALRDRKDDEEDEDVDRASIAKSRRPQADNDDEDEEDNQDDGDQSPKSKSPARRKTARIKAAKRGS
jgi:diguanylate cyclase (GGDEF)-like protein